MSGLSRPLSKIPLFILVAGLALGFAVFTQHAWEDYYITFRSSKNLATGHGLVFNVGDKLHTFTSPLGVLLPAVASLLSGNHSDIAALWIFRVMSAAAFGGAALFLYAIARQLAYATSAILIGLAWFATDAKNLDFTINGMETGFMLLFLAYTLWALFAQSTARWLHLGAAWAGLMWTRPDSFIYIALVSAAGLLFNDSRQTGLTRTQWLRVYVQAGLVTTLLYAPWLAWAGWYYGTPIPHTITAKALVNTGHTPLGALKTFLEMPYLAFTGSLPVKSLFTPSYFMIGGWPPVLLRAAQILGGVCSLVWILPFMRRETRAASLALFGICAYLTYYPYFPFPWYIPAATLLAIFVATGSLSQLLLAVRLKRSHGNSKSVIPYVFATMAVFLGIAILCVNGWFTWQSARQLAAQENYVENGNRRKIGEWLRQNAHPGDTVFMEPLGYIGYYSGLKTYDYPGMSSREMVEARRILGEDWLFLIVYLAPDWIVLRPREAVMINRTPIILNEMYEKVREFDVSSEISALDVRGKSYLQHDSIFQVYRRIKPLHSQDGPFQLASPFPANSFGRDGVDMILAHAPSVATIKVPTGAHHMDIKYGYSSPEAWSGDRQTDGATFVIRWAGPKDVVQLMSTGLNPLEVPADRPIHSFSIELPPHADQGIIVLKVFPGNNTTKDWTAWTKPTFH